MSGQQAMSASAGYVCLVCACVRACLRAYINVCVCEYVGVFMYVHQ